MSALWILILGLGGPGLLPALVVARRSAVLVFLAPLIGAAMAAIGTEIELSLGGSLLKCYTIVAVIVNTGALAWWLASGQFRPVPVASWAWSVVTAATVIGALILPLTAIRAQIVGWDSNSIWLTHTLMVSGGHHALLTGLQNPAYRFSNPDYPPLVPAAGALAFAILGRGHLYAAFAMTVLLNACALGALGTGIAATAANMRHLTRTAGIIGGGSICLVGFAVSGAPGIDGHADLLWSAAAAAAVVWGLVLPCSTQALLIACICAAVASLTKNEGLTTALIVLVLITFRYIPLSLPRFRLHSRPLHDRRKREEARTLPRTWAERAALAILPASPGLVWAAMVRYFGIHDAFFASSAPGSPGSRAHATFDAMAGHLGIASVAFAALLAGCYFLRRDREHAGFASPAWLWAVWFCALTAVFLIYVLGSEPIEWWLLTSVYRTTIFARLLLYADMTIWAVLAFEAAFAHYSKQHGAPFQRSSGSARSQIANEGRPLPHSGTGSSPPAMDSAS